MIINFKIRNYRSFKDEVTFSMEAEASKSKNQNFFEINLPNDNQIRLLKIAMIYGANASGKTNIIRALYQLIGYIFKKPQVESKVGIYDPFLFDIKSTDQNIHFELNFIGPHLIKYNYQVCFNQVQIESENLDYFPLGVKRNLFKRHFEKQSSSNIHIGVLGPEIIKTTGKKEINVFNNQLLLSKFGIDEPIPQLTELFLYLKRYVVINATNTSHQKALKFQLDQLLSKDEKLRQKLNALVRFADTNLNGFNIYDNKDQAIFKNIKESVKYSFDLSPYVVLGIHDVYDDSHETGNIQQLNFEEESMGTRMLYSLGGQVLLTLQNGGSLVVDELDTSLHPFITRMLLMMFQSEKLNPHNAQLIFTSHDMTLLDRDLVRKDQVWIAEKNQFGASDLFSLQDFDGVREETPFDKWYLAGKFGGLPTIKSVDTIFENEEVN